MSAEVASLEACFAAYSSASVENPPLVPSTARTKVSYAEDLESRHHSPLSDEAASLKTPPVLPSSTSHRVYSAGGSVMMEDVQYAPVEPTPAITGSLSSYDSAHFILKGPVGTATGQVHNDGDEVTFSNALLVPNYHRFNNPERFYVIYIESSLPTSLTTWTPLPGSAARAEMVDQLDLRLIWSIISA